MTNPQIGGSDFVYLRGYIQTQCIKKLCTNCNRLALSPQGYHGNLIGTWRIDLQCKTLYAQIVHIWKTGRRCRRILNSNHLHNNGHLTLRMSP